jgi:hypothetical protein
VTLSLLTSANYTVTNPAAATITILDRPLDIWNRANFTAGELANPQISGDTADPDGDGLSNLMEYAMGLSPKTHDFNPFNPQITNGYFIITYSRSKFATDAAIVMETSTDLVTWSSGSGYFQPVNVVDEVTNQVITAQAATPINAGTNVFVRLRATRL